MKSNEASMSCVPPFKVVRSRLKTVTINGKSKIDSTYDDFVELIKLFLCGAEFDEKWYISKYPDVAAAIRAGIYRSGRDHFVEIGYFEGRRPRDFEVDEMWYVEAYPDVAEGIGKGTILSARQHFNEYGYDEGRAPSQSWRMNVIGNRTA